MAQVRIEGRVERSGVTLRYLLEGRDGAPVLMFANSLGTDLDLWDGQLPEFAPLLRVLRFDMRGHGGSSAPPGDYRLEELAWDAVAVLDALGIAQAHLCGLSLGGLVAQMVALRHPERVASLVLCATACRIGDRAGWEERIALVRGGGMTAVAETIIARWFSERFRRDQPERVEAVMRMLLATPPSGYAGCCAAIRDADLCAELGAIRAPTLCLAGAWDPVTPPSCLEELAARIPNARMEVLEAAHLINIEAEDAFHAALGRFLAAQGAL